jgi:uncharacterized protein (TIGR01370 family)
MINLFDSINIFAAKTKPLQSFAVYYGLAEDAKAFNSFALVVLESSYSKIVDELKKEKKIVLAYLSLGEVNSSREYFSYIKEKGFLLEGNPNWPDAFLVDIRNQEWGDYIVETLIPTILDNGFDGIFIDTLDSSIEKERTEPRKFKGMKIAAINIIENARRKFPEMKIMLNRAYGIASDVALSIDYLLGESICNTYDFNTKKYFPVDERSYENQLKILADVKKKNPAIKIMSLDYCDDKDKRRRKEIYRKQRKNGLIPYVTTIDLCKVSGIDDK